MNNVEISCRRLEITKNAMDEAGNKENKKLSVLLKPTFTCVKVRHLIH